ncbi:3-phosphoserine/phosphohydroxythreonine transaminase [Enterococcus saccharolyticus]|uniref:Phosphoserine aminotransferase n=1 Tax=Candidatus Enterococcus willemsii TaxID=1857215 RepID=A0ABQ6Z2G3_9ENTE|nr:MULTISPECIES: 3-phosphoserine/phosphohydroxythreonine transaminase [Enterococcus]KAF1305337.1 phosphoserine transaminase [Enterococcus sp. CU12B]MCD5002971.1 3-phosphoserine/phosphohydroxythreonine transaminase [Enterococcus saccharolyticus]
MTVYNFSAGPAVLPKPVLEKAQAELVNYQGSEMSVMEMSHRSSLYDQIIKDAEQLLRELMAIPDNYKVLFLQGGASLQFSMIPLNLAVGKKALYVNTGAWAKKAISAAKAVAGVDVEVIASSEDQNFTYIPEITKEMIDQDAAYVHITTNETIGGIAFQTIPDVGDVPIVADMSSNILANDYNVEDFGLIYAGAQKNIGPSGVTVVIIREDLLNEEPIFSPMLDFAVQAANDSLYNTPPTYAIYIAKLVFEWLKELGGTQEILKQDRDKAQLLYDAIDASQLFKSPVNQADRSITNIPFITGDEALDKKFNQEALAQGFQNLKGHRSVGGMRASLYNAFPKEGVEALVAFMKKFEEENGER